MTNKDRAVLGGKLFETYLQFEDHCDISDDELDFYVAEHIYNGPTKIIRVPRHSMKAKFQVA